MLLAERFDLIMVKIITSIDEFRRCDDIWSGLSAHYDFFSSQDWLFTWWENYHDEKQLRIYTQIDDDGNIVAVFPLMLQDINGETVLSQLSDSCSDYYRIICDPSHFEKADVLVDYVLSNETFDRFIINNLIEDEANTSFLLKSLISKSNSVNVSLCDYNHYIITTGVYDEYFQSKSSNFRHKIRQVRKNGSDYTFECIENITKEILLKIFDIHRKKWIDEFQISVFNDHRRTSFLTQICNIFSDLGLLRVFLLKDKDQIIAYRLGFVQNNVYYDWNTSYDKNHSNSSVGILLCDYIIRYCFSNSIKEYNFLRGNEEYKKRFSTGTRRLLSITVEKNNVCKNGSVPYVAPPMKRLSDIFHKIKGVIFDLDGVVYRGSIPIHGTITFINNLLDNNISVGFLTNTSTKSSNSIRKKLLSMGICEKPFYIETSSTATASYLRELNIKQCAMCGGEDVLPNEIERFGITTYSLSNSPDEIDAVVVGYAKEFKYEDAARIYELVRNGALLVSTDEDKLFAYNDRCLPGTAWILSSIESITGKKAQVIGKPNSYSAHYLLKKMEIPPIETLLIGDNIESDIVTAKKIGAYSCLLLGGVSSERDVAKLKKDQQPDIVTDDLEKLISFFDSKSH